MNICAGRGTSAEKQSCAQPVDSKNMDNLDGADVGLWEIRLSSSTHHGFTFTVITEEKSNNEWVYVRNFFMHLLIDYGDKTTTFSSLNLKLIIHQVIYSY